MNYILFLISHILFTGVFCFELPFQKCSLRDSDCLTNSAQLVVGYVAKGFPELDAPPLDVLNIENIKYNLAGLDMDMKNVRATGFKNSKIESLSVDVDKKKINLTFVVDIDVNSDYKCKGKLMGLPIYGDGEMELKIKKLKLSLDMPFNIIENSKGKKVINIKFSNYEFDILENLHFNLTNLFDNNKELSKIMLKSINDNWKDLANTFGTTVLAKPVATIAKRIKKYLRSLPLEDITLY